jgi:ubiquitin-protein ligase
MTASVRSRRLENEWALLRRLVAHNGGILEGVRREVQPEGDVFHVILHRTSALALEQPPSLMAVASHTVSFRYPAYYPSVPIEAFLATPVFHPNVHPENGFVCLWSRSSVGDTILEAAGQLQRIITWQLWNDRAEHVMQPEALQWTPNLTLPLSCDPLCIPDDLQLERTYARKPEGSRRRLSAGSL